MTITKPIPAAVKRLDGYIRVSSIAGREGESFISPDLQREKIAAWAKAHDAEIIHWEQDLDVSGGKLERPGLDRIMNRIRSGETGGIAIAALDRFSRAGVGDALALIAEIKDHGAEFLCREPQIDTSDPIMGEFVLTIFLALGRMERLRIGAKWADAKAQAVERGLWIGNTTPFGYRQRDDGRLEPDPVTSPIVTELFRRRAGGESLYQLVKWLHSTGTTPPKHRQGLRAKDKRPRSERDREAAIGKPWTRSGVLQLIKRRAYLGETSSGEYVKTAAHPPLTDPVTWQSAQTGRGPRWTGSGQPPLLLAGLCRCSGCRYTMGSRHHIGTRVWPAYICKRKSEGTKLCPDEAMIDAVTHEPPTDIPYGYCRCGCGKKTKIAEYADKRRGWVKGEPMPCLRGHNLNRDIVGLHEYVIERMWEHLAEIEAQGYGADDGLQEIEDRAKAAHAERLAFAADTELQKVMGRDGYMARMRVLNEQCETADAERDEARRLAHRPLIDKPVRTLRWEFENEMSGEDQRQFMAGMIQAVFVRSSRRHQAGYGASPKRVHVVWATDPAVDVPRQGRRDYVQRPFVFPDDADQPGDVGEAAA
jgi:DNA invertase Pin-like site-specific DNA recombinase